MIELVVEELLLALHMTKHIGLEITEMSIKLPDGETIEVK